MNPAQFRETGMQPFIDLRTLDDYLTKKSLTQSINKEIPVVTGSMDETIIVTYSPSIKLIRERSVPGRLKGHKRSLHPLTENVKEKPE